MIDCPFCGKQGVEPHEKYSDRCVDCGTLYNLYTVRRSKRRKNNGLAVNEFYKHKEVVEQYMKYQQLGFKVPKTLAEEFLALELQQRNIDVYMEHNTKPYICDFCGAVYRKKNVTAPPHICKECSKIRRRFYALRDSIRTLDQDECDELYSLIKHYVRMRDLGFKTPQLHQVKLCLDERIVKIGGEPYESLQTMSKKS